MSLTDIWFFEIYFIRINIYDALQTVDLVGKMVDPVGKTVEMGDRTADKMEMGQTAIQENFLKILPKTAHRLAKSHLLDNLRRMS